MKLTKFAFAKLVAFIMNEFEVHYISDENLQNLDNLVEFDVPDQPAAAPEPIYPATKASDVQALMYALFATNKIEMIKQYRNLTGEGLKESKEAVEDVLPCNYRSQSAYSFKQDLLTAIYSPGSPFDHNTEEFRSQVYDFINDAKIVDR